MPKSIRLLLTESVDNLGIVGDVVTVRPGFARNYLLPHGLATEPTEEAIKAIAQRRAEAERLREQQRAERRVMAEKLHGVEITVERSCNDQGVLYASVTQQDIAAALGQLGFAVRPREVRLPHAIKRIDAYEVQLRFDADLEAVIKLWVVADRKLDLHAPREEMEFDDEGNLIERPAPAAEAGKEEPPAASPAPAAPARSRSRSAARSPR